MGLIKLSRDVKIEQKEMLPNRIYSVAVISSVPPDPNLIAGALILSRWLDHPQIDWTYIEPSVKPPNLLGRVINRLTNSRVHRIAYPIKCFYEGNAVANYLRLKAFFRQCLREVTEMQPQIILSIAHGPYYKIAYRVSKLTGVPLVLLAQDWWPAFEDVKPAHKKKEEQEFISICSKSAATIAVSEGMFKELGSPANTSVVHDIPSAVRLNTTETAVSTSLPLKVIYAGNLATYGPMVEQAALACMDSDLVKLDIFGREPIWWSEGMRTRFEEAGVYRGFVSPTDFAKVAEEYDFVLAIMSFAPELRQRMRTCFLSKIIELAQLGKPIVVWGPEDGSAAVWARKTGAALCVTEESPAALREALERLANDVEEQDRLVRAIQASAANEFNPVKIRQEFMEILEQVSNKSVMQTGS